MADKKTFMCSARTGGTAGCLDDIDHSSISNNDLAIVIEPATEYVYFYYYDTSEAGAESSPTIIIPDSNTSGTGAWKQATIPS